jgi:hypothetical protein
MWRDAAAVACASAAFAAAPAAQQPSLDDVLNRAGTYVAAYHQAVATVIAEERYVQRLVTFGGGSLRPQAPSSATERTLLSDFAIVSGGPGEPAWMAFRDVLDVDGEPVQSRDDRMQRLLTGGGRDGVNRAMALSRESSRYNLASDLFTRTINVPIVALDFLLPETRHRFSFKRQDVRDQDGVRAWEISYREQRRPTVIRTPDGKNVPVHGTFLIDPSTGRVLESVLQTEGAEITVTYAIEPRLQIAVPARMREHYEVIDNRTALFGDATYTNYRRFETAIRLVIPKQR